MTIKSNINSRGDAAVHDASGRPAATRRVPGLPDLTYNDVNNYLEACGLEVASFCEEIRRFMKLSRDHFRRTHFLKYIADSKKLEFNVGSLPDMKKLMKIIGKQQLYSSMRKTRAVAKTGKKNRYSSGHVQRWKNGELDIPWPLLFDYCEAKTLSLRHAWLTDDVGSIRFAMPRVLAFIRLSAVPAEGSSYEVQGLKGLQAEIFKKYKLDNAKRVLNEDTGVRAITQFKLDMIFQTYSEFELLPSRVVEFHDEFQSSTYDDGSWYWPFALFKFATYADDPREDEYDYRCLWDREHDLWRDTWRKENGD